MLHIILNLMLLPTAWGTEVAFIQAHQKGQLVQLEPGGRFYHVAIRYGERWLHARPYWGVEFVDDLSQFGDRVVVLRNESECAPNDQYVTAWLGKAFDPHFRWKNSEATYCSRLVGEALGVTPKPMTYTASHWTNRQIESRGDVGLSPDDLYRALRARGYTSCESELE